MFTNKILQKQSPKAVSEDLTTLSNSDVFYEQHLNHSFKIQTPENFFYPPESSYRKIYICPQNKKSKINAMTSEDPHKYSHTKNGPGKKEKKNHCLLKGRTGVMAIFKTETTDEIFRRSEFFPFS